MDIRNSEGMFNANSNTPLQQLVSSIYETFKKLINLKNKAKSKFLFQSTLRLIVPIENKTYQ